MFLISFYIIENVENDNGKFKDEMVLIKRFPAIGMEVEIPQQALGKALARGIATDSPAFFSVWKSVGKKDCPHSPII